MNLSDLWISALNKIGVYLDSIKTNKRFERSDMKSITDLITSEVILKSFTIDCYLTIPDELRPGDEVEFNEGTYFISEINCSKYLTGDWYEIKPLWEVTFTKIS